MSRRYYNIFISHAWDYTEEYDGVVRLLNASPRFRWKDYSVPEARPLATPENWVRRKDIKAGISRRIAQSSCFVLTARMYIHYRRWIQDEIDLAIAMEKPIVAIRSWGSVRTPADLEEYADRICGWRARSLVDAIRSAVREN